RAVIERATDRDSTKRYPTCEDMIEALREACGRPRAPLTPPPMAPVTPPPLLPDQTHRTTGRAAADETPHEVPSQLVRAQRRFLARPWQQAGALGAALAILAIVGAALLGLSGNRTPIVPPSFPSLPGHWSGLPRAWAIAAEKGLHPLMRQVQCEENLQQSIKAKEFREACEQIENTSDISWTTRSGYREMARREWISHIQTLFGSNDPTARAACTQILRHFPVETQVYLLRARTALLASDFLAARKDLDDMKSMPAFAGGEHLRL